jgi:hypothetical protein
MTPLGRHLMVGAVAAGLSLPTDFPATARDGFQLYTLRQVFVLLGQCWRPPRLAPGQRGMQITVLVSFKTNGRILGRPRNTFESEEAPDEERLVYRTAVMETLERCTPLPLTEGLAGAIAGHPLVVRFDDRKNAPAPRPFEFPSKPKERDI